MANMKDYAYEILDMFLVRYDGSDVNMIINVLDTLSSELEDEFYNDGYEAAKKELEE